MQADGVWRMDEDYIDADNIFIGMARDHDTLEEIGVVIALKVTINGKELHVNATMPPDQALEVSDAINVAVQDMQLAK